jgi:ribosome-associated protein
MSLEDLHKEVKYRTSRSGGAGGQHVNKVSTKVELLFDIEASEILNHNKKVIILYKLKNRISSEGIFALQCDETRSQSRNKEIAFDRFINLIKTALTPVKVRRKTKPTRSSVRRRLDGKKKLAQKKSNRKFKED